MANKIQFKRGLKASIPPLDAGEPGFCTDTGELYVGTGSGNEGVAKAVHTHDDRYYTEGEIDTKLSAKSDTSHTHTFSSVTSKPTTLSGYGITDAVPSSRTVNGKALSANVTLAGADIAIADAGGYYTTDTVEASLQEVGAKINAPARTVNIVNNESIITVGKGKSEAGADLDYSASVTNGLLSEAKIKGRTLTNIVQNGNFANGTTGWSAYNATVSAASNVLSVKGAVGATGIVETYRSDVKSNANNKYYTRLLARVTNADCQSMKVYGGSSYPFSQGLLVVATNPTQNIWYPFSAIYSRTSVNPSGNGMLVLQHTYINNATAIDKVMEVKDVVAVDLTSTFGAGNEPSLADCDKMMNFYWDGTKSTFQNGFRLQSVGKNLFDKSKATLGVRVNQTDGTNYVASDKFVSAYIPIKPSTAYYAATSHFAWYDSNKNFISGGYDMATQTAPSSARYIRISNNLTSIDVQQLELGTTATTYEAYRQNESIVALSEPLRSVPNGTKDEISVSADGKVSEVRKNKSYVLQSADISSLTTSGVNTDYVTILLSSLAGAVAGNANSIDGQARINGYTETTYAVRDNIESIGKFVYGSTSILLIFPKGTYVNLAAAQTALAGTSLIYQLATPVTTEIKGVAPVSVYPKGTLYIDGYIKKLFTYATASSGIAWTTPVSGIDRIEAIEGGEYVEIPSTRYTLASDGKSVRIYTTDAKTVEVTDATPFMLFAPTKQEESTVAELVATYPTNLSASVADNNARSIKNAQDIMTIADQVAMLIVLNS